MGNSKNLSYCTQFVRDHSPDRFLLSLFVPTFCRETLLCLYALDAELAHVHHVVREEMLGHVRYAWWYEGVESIAGGQPPRDHPVLQALTPESATKYLPLVEIYRRCFPAMPPGQELLLDELALALIREACPEAEPGWQEAKNIISNHRQRFGGRFNSWLHLKLMLLGLF